MEELFAKIKEYVNMDTEISTAEFSAYYKKVIDKLVADFDKLSEEELFQAKAIASIVSGNAATRSKRKDADAKKFRKMQEKSSFWADAIEYRLKKSGLSEDDVAKGSAEVEAKLHGSGAAEEEDASAAEAAADAGTEAEAGAGAH
ncbi:MAG: hypothetical protein FWG28_06305 [Clostridiales bacterium]|nr:hypothetical protein [Clostridiales bacterium]